MLRSFLTTLALASFATANDHSPDQFSHHDDVRIELFASEPDVVDPVALTFAANGDCYVVEMRDYPYGFGDDRKPGGTIRLLRDTDHDGRADESHLFAEQLSFPTSVMAWRDGILVVAPPRILFLRDTDGDDRADVTETVIDGLRLGVTDSNANSLRWGIDNRIHVANGGNGGKVAFANQADPINLGYNDFAFDFEKRSIAKTFRTGGGFGLVFDAFGHSFTTYNINYLQQRILPTRHSDISPGAPAIRGTENISDHGPSARIFPIVQAVTRVNHPEQAGHFSSAGGMGILNSPDYSPRLANSVLVCDVVCNLVHRDLLRDDGPVFRAARAPEEQQTEFIASRDPAFRPVGLEDGPDGALYLLDMQRDVIEHPDYIPQRVRETVDLRGGQDRGRIYRVTPKDAQLKSLPPLDLADSRQLVRELASPHAWRRTTAHRLLVDAMDQSTAADVREFGLKSQSAPARAASLWILNAVGDLHRDDFAGAINDESPGVRENAIELLQRQGGHVDMILKATDDEHSRVRFCATLALDGIEHADKATRLERVLMRDYEHAWSRNAVALAIDKDARSLLVGLWDSEAFDKLSNEEAKLALLRELADVAAATPADNDDPLAEWLTQLNLGKTDITQAEALLTGLSAGWQRQTDGRLGSADAKRVLTAWATNGAAKFAGPLLDLAAMYGLDPPQQLTTILAESRETASADDLPVEARIAAIELLSRSAENDSFELLLDLLSRPESTAIQQAAIDSLRGMHHDDAGKRLLQVWDRMSPGVRNSVITLLLSRRNFQSDLIAALEKGTVRFAELNLDLEQRRRLLRSSDQEISTRAANFFSDEEYSNRKEIVGEWLAQLPSKGDVVVGQKVFHDKCAICHVIRGQGKHVGPDLQALSHRSVEDLLTHILDPNMSINPNYVACLIETSDGQIISGLLASETADTVTIMQPEAKAVTIERSEIEQLKTRETSLMPEGLEKDITPEQMRSLIEYLQS